MCYQSVCRRHGCGIRDVFSDYVGIWQRDWKCVLRVYGDMVNGLEMYLGFGHGQGIGYEF